MKIRVKVQYVLFYNLCRLLGYLPAWFLYYPLAELVYFFLYRVARYRVKVTRENLYNSFPNKNKRELRKVERQYYRHLSEVFIDTVDLTGISKKQLAKRMHFLNEEEHRCETDGMDWIAATAHYGSWEYFMAYALGDPAGRELTGVYRPLHTQAVDMLYRKLRSRMGMVPVSVNVLLRHIIRNRRDGIKMTLGLISDQSPYWFDIERWFNFLNQPTGFFHGMEDIAVRFGMPVYFVHISKIRRAHYELWFEKIYDGKEKTEPYEITGRYVNRLEKMIEERPELWMWSHRRWKHKPKDQEESKTDN